MSAHRSGLALLTAALPALLATVLGMLLAPLPARAAQTDQFELRAYVNDACVVADEPYYVPQENTPSTMVASRVVALAAIVVGKVADLLINYVVHNASGRVSAKGARQDTHYAYTREMNLYLAEFTPTPTLRLNAHLGCLTLVAARFQPEGSSCAAAYDPKTLAVEVRDRPENEWHTSRSDDSVENSLRRANICVDGRARAVYEARFEFSPDGTAYRLRDAGYRIDSLLTTTDPKAQRSVFYTLAISEPDQANQPHQLSQAWVNLGNVAAGAKSVGSEQPPQWLHVPGLSPDARRAYEQQTQAQHEVAGEIEALQRAMTRTRRMIDGLDQRLGAATGDMAEGLKQERTRLSVQTQTQEVELEARQAEYRDLPLKPLEFMPVSISVGVTESRSEQKALVMLADVINSNGPELASAVSSGLFSRSLDAEVTPAVATAPANATSRASVAAPAGDAGAALERARAHYFDVLVQTRTDATAAANADTQRELAQARAAYTDARRAVGLGALP
jgi:hypothetical protein